MEKPKERNLSMHNWKKEILTIPNLLSLFRFLLIPVYTTMFLNAEQPSDYWLAAGTLALSTLTDFIDGKIARHFNMITNVGKILDPLADKATQFALLVCLVVRHQILWIVILLFVAKETFMLTMGLINLRKRKMLDGALLSGKICTTVLFISMTLLVLLPDINNDAVKILVVLCVAAILWAFIDYAKAYFGKEKKIRDI